MIVETGIVSPYIPRSYEEVEALYILTRQFVGIRDEFLTE